MATKAARAKRKQAKRAKAEAEAVEVKKRQASYVIVNVDETPGPPPELSSLPPKMLHNWELTMVRAIAGKYESDLRAELERQGVPLPVIELLPPKGKESEGIIFICPRTYIARVYVEACLTARVQWPWVRWPGVDQDEEDDNSNPADDDQGYSGSDEVQPGRLTIHGLPTAKPERLPANMPGCRGVTSEGDKCTRFRQKGELYCPRCRHEKKREMRTGG